MRLLLLIALVALVAWMMKDTQLADQLKGKALAKAEELQHQALQIAAEKAAELASSKLPAPEQPQYFYAAADLVQNIDGVARVIPKGCLIRIVETSGDQITVSNGLVMVTTTPEGITNVSPYASVSVPKAISLDSPPQSQDLQPQTQVESPYPNNPPSSFNPLAPRDTDTPQQLRIKQRIAEIDQQIRLLEQAAQAATANRNQIQATRNRRQIDDLNLQRDNLIRSLN